MSITRIMLDRWLIPQLQEVIQMKMSKGDIQAELDLTDYVKTEKFYEVLKKYNRNIEKIFEELESLRRDLTELQIFNKDVEKKERIDRLEEDIYYKYPSQIHFFLN